LMPYLMWLLPNQAGPALVLLGALSILLGLVALGFTLRAPQIDRRLGMAELGASELAGSERAVDAPRS
jgi:hypothetical protein